MLLHQRLRRFAKAGRAAISANRQASRLACDGARLGARAEGPGNAVGHGPEYGGGKGSWLGAPPPQGPVATQVMDWKPSQMMARADHPAFRLVFRGVRLGIGGLCRLLQAPGWACIHGTRLNQSRPLVVASLRAHMCKFLLRLRVK
jgi:hypothetical protein